MGVDRQGVVSKAHRGRRGLLRGRFLLLALAAVAAAVIVWPAGAAPPQPSSGVANVDGASAEWDLGADFFADLHKSGDASKPLIAKLYLRYDCATRTLYALVLAQPGWKLLANDPSETYVMVDGSKIVHAASGDNGIPPDFQWINAAGTEADGFEASGEVLIGAHQLRVHAKFPQADADGYDVIDVVGRTVPLVVSCGSSGQGGNGGGGGGGPGPGAVTADVPADVGITKSADPRSIAVNGQSAFTLRVTNLGTVTATGVTVTDTLPDRVAFVSVSTTRGSCSGTTTIVCQLGTLAPGDVVTIRIVVVGAVPGDALNVAVVKINEPEANLANNRAEASIRIEAPQGQELPCYFLSARKTTLSLDKTTTVSVTVRLAGKRVKGVKIVARGAGVNAKAISDGNGVAHLRLRPTKTGIVRIKAVPERPSRSPSRAGGQNCGLAFGLGVAGVASEKRLTG